jgi:adenosylhomocysteinase
MDMSFALQALTARHVVEQGRALEASCYPVPAAIDEQVARLKLAAAGVSIDTLTADQRDYLAHWQA